MVDRLVNSETNRNRIARVEACFGSFGQPLAVPGRVLVGEGILVKTCRRKSKPRQVFLFNDILIYGSIVISRKKFTGQHIIKLEDVSLRDIPDSDGDDPKYGWLIMTPHKSFAVHAANESEKQQWMMHISNCVEERLLITGKQGPSIHAAVWVPDSDTTVCMVCRRTKFTVINRRHHCRACGLVVCGNCSKNKILIASQSDKPVRVCDQCYAGKRGASTRTFVRQTTSTGPPARPAPPLTTPSISQDSTSVEFPPVTSPKEVDNNDFNSSNLSDVDTQKPDEAADDQLARRESEDLDASRTGDTSDDSDPEEDREKTIDDIESLALDDQKPTFYNESANGDEAEKRKSSPDEDAAQPVTTPAANGTKTSSQNESTEKGLTTPTDR